MPTDFIPIPKMRRKAMDLCISSSDWGALPADILKQIHTRLAYFTDQVCFGAVCKHWHKSCRNEKNVHPRIPYSIPWIFRHEFMWSTGEDVEPFSSKLIDPYAKHIHRVSCCRARVFSADCFDNTVAYASMTGGWVLLGHQRDNMILPRKTSMFLRNVYTNEVILLPVLDLDCLAATFVKKTAPGDFLVMSIGYGHRIDKRSKPYVCFASISLLKDKDWRVCPRLFFPEPRQSSCTLHYLSGILYCAWNDGGLLMLNVTNWAFEELSRTWWSHLEGCWLVDNNKEGVLKGFYILAKSKSGDWSVFRFDMRERKWFPILAMNSTGFFVSGKVAISAPLLDLNGDKMADCRVYYDSNGLIECYSLCQRKYLELDMYNGLIGKVGCGKICFVQPPPSRN